jgi:lipopolysaccharide cholinephosphotransferase
MTFQLRKVQKTEIEILKEIDRICKKYNIIYFLDYGSALGAIRHGGFIPWDDDIDVGMLRNDYNKFIKIAPKELDSCFFLQNTDTEKKSPCLYAKVRKNDTIYMEWCHRNINMHQGVYVDIFPYDNVPDESEIGYLAFKRKCKMFTNLYHYRLTPYRYTQTDNTIKGYTLSIARRAIFYVLQIIPRKIIINEINALITKFSNVPCKKVWLIMETEKVVPVGKKLLLPVKYMTFEDRQYPVPNKISEYLTIRYGDWKKLPPESERIGHQPYKIKI